MIGTCDAETYPLQKKRHSMEFLRSIAHLRPRTNSLGAVARVRSALAYATHKFFQDRGFFYLQVRAVVCCRPTACHPTAWRGMAGCVDVCAGRPLTTSLYTCFPTQSPLITASDCEGAGEMFRVSTFSDDVTKIPRQEGNKDLIDYSKDFFGAPAYLTVSGQLSAETHACALGDVYTFGPTFRAENSQVRACGHR